MKLDLSKNKHYEENKFVILSFLLLLAIAISMRFLFSNPRKPSISTEVPDRADSYIPAGFVLVPLELSNQEQIQAVIESFGFVDLFVGKPGQLGSKKLFRRIKVIRAKQEQMGYLALVTEYQAELLMKNSGTFWAVVQNPKAKDSFSNQDTQKRTPLKIEYYKGG